MQFKPTFDRVLVEVEKKSEKVSKSGYSIAGTGSSMNTNEAQEGIIVSTGPGRYEHGIFVPISFKAGQQILFQKFSGHKIESDDSKKEYVILRESDILAITSTDTTTTVTESVGNFESTSDIPVAAV